MDEARIAAVDAQLTTLVAEDAALADARTSTEVTSPGIEVAPTLGKLLHLLALIRGARRVLEFGTLAGYSTIWLARAVGPAGRVVSLELDRDNATLARRHLTDAGVSAWVDILCGPAERTSALMVERGEAPFDLVFIDADKESNTVYLDWAARLGRSGTVIVLDNIGREGEIVNADTDDPRVVGTREGLQMLGEDPRFDATALQTVGIKGWDGVALALVL